MNRYSKTANAPVLFSLGEQRAERCCTTYYCTVLLLFRSDRLLGLTMRRIEENTERKLHSVEANITILTS